jgi:hypothetical protein
MQEKHLSDVFPIKNSLASLFFYISLGSAVTRFKVNQGGVELNGTSQLVLYADDVNIFDGSLHTIKKNREHLVVSCKETGLELNADKTKHMFMSRDQNAG